MQVGAIYLFFDGPNEYRLLIIIKSNIIYIFKNEKKI